MSLLNLHVRDLLVVQIGQNDTGGPTVIAMAALVHQSSLQMHGLLLWQAVAWDALPTCT